MRDLRISLPSFRLGERDAVTCWTELSNKPLLIVFAGSFLFLIRICFGLSLNFYEGPCAASAGLRGNSSVGTSVLYTSLESIKSLISLFLFIWIGSLIASFLNVLSFYFLKLGIIDLIISSIDLVFSAINLRSL